MSRPQTFYVLDPSGARWHAVRALPDAEYTARAICNARPEREGWPAVAGSVPEGDKLCERCNEVLEQ